MVLQYYRPLSEPFDLDMSCNPIMVYEAIKIELFLNTSLQPLTWVYLLLQLLILIKLNVGHKNE